MHLHDAAAQRLTDAIVRYAVDRVRMDPVPLDGPQTPDQLAAACGPTITAGGLGGPRTLELFTDVLAPACISVDHPRYLSFVPCAATEAAVLFDLVVGASSIYGGSWLEGAGAVFAENEALRWIADLAGFPATAAGVFVTGGTAGNLSALLAARWAWRQAAAGAHDRTRGLVIASAGAHSSVAHAARVMDCDVIAVAAEPSGRMSGAALRSTLDAVSDTDRARLFAIVATAGTTNAGVVDDLAGAADAAEATGCWLHVDGAYGGAALAAPSVRARFAGVERADSFIVDPHKWLFAPFDSCALVYRDPRLARDAHTQHAEYLDVLHGDRGDGGDSGEGWNPSDANPSDLAHHLTRRARGLPFWFSLAAHGSDAYTQAIETTLHVAHAGAELIRASEHCELVVEPELSVVVFRRLGWGPADYQAWSDAMLASGEAFVVPTAWDGETVLRICVVNPRTTLADIEFLVDSLAR
ncbi:MAG TPA: pyridoxal-dependent decarboxylase [Ilumatobacter sp.]|nr:pyridoxal-dependent decarboxylase [Ilumatobacter sp.]